MMVVIMCRLTLSVGASFLNVYVLEVFATSIRHYALSFLVFLTEFVFIFFEPYEAACEFLGISSAFGILMGLVLGKGGREENDW